MTAPLTLEEIDALEKLERAATVGPWRFRGDDDSYPHRHMAVGIPRVGMLDNVDADPQFVAAARNALPALLSMAREQASVVKTIVCSFCGEVTNRGATHEVDTQLMADHIMRCAKHPMMRLLEEAEALKLLESALEFLDRKASVIDPRDEDKCWGMTPDQLLELATELGWTPPVKGESHRQPEWCSLATSNAKTLKQVSWFMNQQSHRQPGRKSRSQLTRIRPTLRRSASTVTRTTMASGLKSRAAKRVRRTSVACRSSVR
jgi:hypothetical protein